MFNLLYIHKPRTYLLTMCAVLENIVYDSLCLSCSLLVPSHMPNCQYFEHAKWMFVVHFLISINLRLIRSIRIPYDSISFFNSFLLTALCTFFWIPFNIRAYAPQKIIERHLHKLNMCKPAQFRLWHRPLFAIFILVPTQKKTLSTIRWIDV